MEEKKNNNLASINFDAVNIPQPTESKSSNDTPVQWGDSNKYPLFLLSELYAKSPIHSNIINGKSTHIVGDGLYSKATNKPLVLKPNTDDTLELFVDKIVKDYLIFNAFAIEVNFSVVDGSIVNYYHIPMQRIGLNEAKDKVFYFGDNTRNKVSQIFDRYDPSVKYSDSNSKVFYYEGYTPSVSNTYPTPDYHQLIKTIMTDISITDFNYNQISNHFSVSTMIDFFNGEPDDEIKKAVVRDLKASYTGEQGKKLLVSFNNPSGKPTEIKNLTSGDWNDAYLSIKESVESSIYKGHSITSPAIFGDKTEGQLGSSQELENAYEIWNNSYLRVKRNELEAPLRELFATDIFFQNKPLFSTSVSEELKKGIMTINELRKESGLAPIIDGYRMIGSSVPASTPSTFSEEKKEEHGKILTEDDFEKIKDLGSSVEDYDEYEGEQFSLQLKFDDFADILQHILDKGLTNLSSAELRAEIKSSLNIEITTSDLKSLMTDLHKSGVANVEVRDGKYVITNVPNTPTKVPDSKEVLVMFKYSKRPEIEGEEIISTSRGFCIKLSESGKLYSREDIQSMSAIFGYDVMKHTGGFYFNPKTGVTTPYCRHFWKQVSVVRKNKTN
jgi:hypothetical protein